MSAVLDPPTLDNCDREPIHIPGHIQSHGALLAFDRQGVVRWASETAAEVLGCSVPAPGQRAAPGDFAGAAERLAEGLRQARAQHADGAAFQDEIQLGARTLDLIFHGCGDLEVAEFEPQGSDAASTATFAVHAHKAIARLRRKRSIQELLDAAVEEVRALTGFDRVMAYRFRHDASGDIVSEAKSDALESFLNRRYPASDIPVQARRLYVENTLRLIADVRSPRVAVRGTDAAPLDMSHCTLRSVSPIHIEYLGNMGVGASMSVSIVVGGQLWGMIACHHMGPRHVPYAIRMACDVLAQVLAASVLALSAAQDARRDSQAADLRARLVERLLQAEDAVSAIAPLAEPLGALMGAPALLLAEKGRVFVQGGLDAAVAGELVAWLAGQHPQARSGMLAVHTLASLPAALAARLGVWCGLMALRFDDVLDGWLVFVRPEQIETVQWGGKPEKVYVNGPLGPRLTPRGSFDVWRETVRGSAVPWDEADIAIARQLRDELGRATASRHAQLSRARDQMLAVLGHDLRNPLQTISMTAHVLERGGDGVAMGRRLHSATTRMDRLISQVLDMSRLQNGLGLGLGFARLDVAALTRDLLADLRLAYPDALFDAALPPELAADVDGDRLLQVLANLLTNARHHGQAGKAIRIGLAEEGADMVVRVDNVAAPIPEDALAQLFTPFKRQSLGHLANRGGLGLGLYIAREIAVGHGGSLRYGHDGERVVFTARWPRFRPD